MVLINRCQKAKVLIVWCQKAVVLIVIVPKRRITEFLIGEQIKKFVLIEIVPKHRITHFSLKFLVVNMSKIVSSKKL